MTTTAGRCSSKKIIIQGLLSSNNVCWKPWKTKISCINPILKPLEWTGAVINASQMACPGFVKITKDSSQTLDSYCWILLQNPFFKSCGSFAVWRWRLRIQTNSCQIKSPHGFFTQWGSEEFSALENMAVHT